MSYLLHVIIGWYNTYRSMFRFHPVLSEIPIRDYGTVYATDDSVFVDVGLSSPVTTQTTRGQVLLTVNDMQKITQVTTNELIASNEIYAVTNMSLKYTIALTYNSIHKHVCPEIPTKQLARLVVCVMEQLIEHTNRSERTKVQLIQRLTDQDIAAFIDRIITQPDVESDVNNMKRGVGCFDWVRGLFVCT